VMLVPLTMAVSRWVHRKAEDLPRCPASWLVLQRREVPGWAPPA
jgi:hypothetical protein